VNNSCEATPDNNPLSFILQPQERYSKAFFQIFNTSYDLSLVHGSLMSLSIKFRLKLSEGYLDLSVSMKEKKQCNKNQ